jgi:hypothetical protein
VAEPFGSSVASVLERIAETLAAGASDSAARPARYRCGRDEAVRVPAIRSHVAPAFVEKQRRQPDLPSVGLPESKRERDQCARTHPLGMSRAAPLVVGAGIKLSTLTPERLEATTSQ